MKKYLCEMCGKKTTRLLNLKRIYDVPLRFSHDGSDDTIVRLCPKCYRKAEANLRSLILESMVW